MKTTIRFMVATAVVAVLASGGVVAQEAQHDHQHDTAAAAGQPKQESTPPQAGADNRTKPANGSMMDMTAMCEMHRKMMGTKSSTERDRMAKKEMKGMSAEQRRQRMKMMDENCK
ncbi:hypothetical protein E4L96_19760 [Massilia arenosa]|uniref:Pentapeptide MXKDX repeat protein n=1 Tax=Zemynaea arenosa TaxID=2561931 RepID=A0A4Y9S081_9BURK|nr:hypothetical protein [Massilia arenosa]TFW13339.1 hypothetical protein E4L96_19760 [Massilia arenosa]